MHNKLPNRLSISRNNLNFRWQITLGDLSHFTDQKELLIFWLMATKLESKRRKDSEMQESSVNGGHGPLKSLDSTPSSIILWLCCQAFATFVKKCSLIQMVNAIAQNLKNEIKYYTPKQTYFVRHCIYLFSFNVSAIGSFNSTRRLSLCLSGWDVFSAGSSRRGSPLALKGHHCGCVVL